MRRLTILHRSSAPAPAPAAAPAPTRARGAADLDFLRELVATPAPVEPRSPKVDCGCDDDLVDCVRRTLAARSRTASVATS